MTAAAPDTAPGRTCPPIVIDLDEDPAVRMVFTGRTPPDGGTDSANLSLLVGGGDVAAARRAALAVAGASLSQAVFMAQVHGGKVAEVTVADAGAGAHDPAAAVPDVDALVAQATDLALAVLVADCVPVLLAVPGRAVAAVHAGRGGVAADVVATAVRRLAPDDVGDVVAVIGPAIGGCCYEVPAAMADALGGRWPAARATTSWGTPSLDLPAAVAAQLRQAGVSRLRQVGSCTHCDADRWFSHRASAHGAPPGRQAGLIVRRSAIQAAPDRSRSVGSLESPVRR